MPSTFSQIVLIKIPQLFSKQIIIFPNAQLVLHLEFIRTGKAHISTYYQHS